MKLFLVALALYSTAALCSTPQVTCAVWYSRIDSEGINVGGREDDIEVSLKKNANVEKIHSFKVETNLAQNFIGGGGGLGIYNLMVEISKGESTSKLNVTLRHPNEPYLISLIVGNEKLHMDCEAITL